MAPLASEPAFTRQPSVKALSRCTIPAGSKSTALPLRWMTKAPQRGDRDDRSGRIAVVRASAGLTSPFHWIRAALSPAVSDVILRKASQTTGGDDRSTRCRPHHPLAQCMDPEAQGALLPFRRCRSETGIGRISSDATVGLRRSYGLTPNALARRHAARWPRHRGSRRSFSSTARLWVRRAGYRSRASLSGAGASPWSRCCSVSPRPPNPGGEEHIAHAHTARRSRACVDRRSSSHSRLPFAATDAHRIKRPGRLSQPAPSSPRCDHRKKASRSALIVSAWVVGRPCGNPSYVLSVPFCTSSTDSGAESL